MTGGEDPMITPAELARLESAVGTALRAADDRGLDVLGYGEITLVVGWPTGAPTVAAKRLPLFDDLPAAERYGRLVEEYLEALTDRGVTPVPSQYHLTPAALAGGTSADADGWAGYVVQPILAPDDLAPRMLADLARRGERDAATELLRAVVGAIAAAVDERVGVDGQLSNWAGRPDELRYLDVTTPLLNDPTGRARLDLRLLTSPLPAPTRPLIRRFVAPGITARYHRPRDVLVDLAGNLLKERLGDWLPTVVELANDHLEQPVTEEEVRRYYRFDALTWELMLRLRRADRWWQRRVRRRPYPSLLPRDVQR